MEKDSVSTAAAHGASPIGQEADGVKQLDPDWLAIELASSRREIKRWPIGLRQSFASLHREAIAEKP